MMNGQVFSLPQNLPDSGLVIADPQAPGVHGSGVHGIPAPR